MTHPCPKMNVVPKTVLMRSGLVSLTTARPVNTSQPRTTVDSARPMTNVFNKAYSTIRRPIKKNTIFKNSNFSQRVNIVKDKNVNAARPKAVVNDVKQKAVLNAIKGNQEKVVIDNGCSRHMTRNMSYLTDFEEIDGRYVAFGGNPKGGKITVRGRKPALGFMRPFGCPVIILNTIDHLGKFDGKADEGFFVGYSINSKAFRVFNSRTRIVKENLHVQFSENTPNIAESGPNLLFDMDALTKSKNYKPVIAGNYLKSYPDVGFKPSVGDEKKVTEEPRKEGGDPSKEGESNKQEKDDNVNSTNTINAASTNEVNVVGAKTSIELPDDPNMPELEDIVYSDDDEDVGAEADMNNLDVFMPDPSWIEAMQEELLQFKLQEVWTLVDLPNGKKAIGTKWVFKNKKDEKGIVIKNKARLVAQGYTQEEGTDYDDMHVKSAFLFGKIEEEVYVCQPPGFEDPDFPNRVYKVENALYELHQAPRSWDKGDIMLVQVYVDDIIFGSTKKSLCTEFEKMMHKKFHMSFIGEFIFFLGLQVKQKKDGIFISQDKYVIKILKKFGFTNVKTASTPIKTQTLLLKDEDGEEVDVHLYRLMIGSLMYLTSSRPDIIFTVCACARYQINPNILHLHSVKRIFRYLKGQPKLGLWYPKDSPFNLVAYSDSDYARASLDRKFTTGGYQFLGSKSISWQCKK
ncbi:putative ribonuclease H-like domain-containing protein [Tanacetum coccineum]|uniref:Ribonuclease H-like domain-containing protein n=1 Tax=Tanacetum coccineum TaxID=301880 RepID=A0ABQ5EW06_9ASTR